LIIYIKKNIILVLFIITPFYLFAQNSLYKAVYNGDIIYIKNYISNFSNFSPWNLEHEYFSNVNDLRLLRNTIYAMHGYIFRSKDLQEHFGKFLWYKGTKDNVESELNENEKN